MKKLKVTLFGFGNMGKNHARVLREHPGIELLGVIDPKMDGQPGFSADWKPEWVDASDAFVVASGTETHHALGMKLLELGKPILIEKPLADDFKNAKALSDQARASGSLLAVGHLERFNPAVRKLKEVLSAGWVGEPIHFSVTRVGGYPQHVSPHNNVLVDLAVHDFDVLNHLVGPMKVVSGIGHQTWKQGIIDTAEIIAKSEKGPSASLHVNWVTPTKIRTLRVTGTKGVCFVDYILQTCTLYGGNLLKEVPANEFNFHSLLEDYRNTDRVEFGVKKEEPLKVQLNEFIKAASGRKSELCLHADALYAVQAAESALQATLKG